MKKLYASTFLPGLERPAQRLIAKEGGVSPESVGRGIVLYRSVREPQIAFAHQTFLVLARMKPFPEPNAAIRRLLSTGGWLDFIPFEEAQGKRFRITISDGEKKIPAGMRDVALLEQAICEHTGMHVNRERPDVELWVQCRGDMSLFLWRIDRNRGEAGRMRRDVACVMAYMLGYDQASVAVLGSADENLIAALSQQGARRIIAATPNPEALGRLAHTPRVRGIEASPEHTGLEAHSQSAVCLDLFTDRKAVPVSLRTALYEAERIAEPGARMALLLPGALVKAAGLGGRETTERITLVQGGQEAQLIALQAAERQEDAQ